MTSSHDGRAALYPVDDDGFPVDRTVAHLRVPPHSIEAESGVLCALLTDNASWDRIGDLLTEEDFYRREHRMIFAAVSALINASKPADIITVFEHLRDREEEDEVGGLAYLNQLAGYSPSSANARRYAEIVRENAVRRQLITRGEEIVSTAFSPGGKPVSQMLDEAEASIMGIGDASARGKSSTHDISQVVVDVLDRIQELADKDSEITGTPTGYYDIDRMTAGMQAGDLIVIAARPSMGKTAFAINIAEHVALDAGLPVAVFSMEMGASQLGVRIIGSIGRINQQHLRTGKLTDEEWPRLTEAVEKMRQCKMEIDDTGGMTIGELRASARRIARRQGGKLGLIVVDYIQLMNTSSNMTDENRATAVGEISRGLKLLARELECPVIALSQLNRGVEQRSDKRPMMSDIRESGAIEQDADTIMFIYRDDYYNKDSTEPGVAEINISKQRNGPTGVVKLAFIKPLTKFESLSHGAD